ncbi:uncharacterized protein QC761_110650 [Podospora bellae-mahoneyi]|uniref:Uncharacterized protein n=1 Tax=Podospora bellae-mahoneyi TaxID=2093777 RepID=A0ABR0FX30_9PEZI|nr:hypothetical protein QC761_110650 [Podospora bellae-mahoneyi]
MKDRASDPLKLNHFLHQLEFDIKLRLSSYLRSLNAPQPKNIQMSNIQHAFTLRAEAFTPSRGV